MSQIIGADTALLRETAQRMRSYVADVETQDATLHTYLERLAAAWAGRASDGASALWETTRQAVHTQISTVNELATQLDRLAERLEHATTYFNFENADQSEALGNASSPNNQIQGSSLEGIYRILDRVPFVQQPTTMSCWAAAITMMLSWRDRTSYSIPQALAMVGQQYQIDFAGNAGLSSRAEATFVEDLRVQGMQASPLMSYSPTDLKEMIKQHGPLFAVGDEWTNGSDPGSRRAVHARIITGIGGDGSPGQTWLEILDPAHSDGLPYWEPYDLFRRKYEEIQRDDAEYGVNIRAQILHFE